MDSEKFETDDSIINTVKQIGTNLFNTENTAIGVLMMIWMFSVFSYNFEYAIEKSEAVSEVLKMAKFRLRKRISKLSSIIFKPKTDVESHDDEIVAGKNRYDKYAYDEPSTFQKYFPVLLLTVHSLFYKFSHLPIRNFTVLILLIYLSKFIIFVIKKYKINQKIPSTDDEKLREIVKYARISSLYLISLFTLLLSAVFLFEHRMIMTMQLLVVIVPLCDLELGKFFKFCKDPSSFENERKDMSIRRWFRRKFEEFIAPLFANKISPAASCKISYHPKDCIVGVDGKLQEINKKVTSGIKNACDSVTNTIENTVDNTLSYISDRV